MTHNNQQSFTLSALIKGLDVQVQGNVDTIIHSIATIQSASVGQLTFLMNPRYKKFLASTQASAVILSPQDAKDFAGNAIIAKDPYYTYAKIAAYFKPIAKKAAGVHASAVVEATAQIHPDAVIGPLCYIGHHVKIESGVTLGPNCVIGDACVLALGAHLDANVTLYSRVHLGQRVRIASGAVIGSEGFGIAKHAGSWHKVPQLGRVVLEDDVEVGANCAIDRGAIEDTVIEKGSKLDNLIQIGHNVRVGQQTAIAGCVGIAGSAVIGKNCLIGGGVGVSGHISIADNVMVTGYSAITSTIHQAGVYSSGVGGVVENKKWQKNSARVNRLKSLNDRVKALESVVKALNKE